MWVSTYCCGTLDCASAQRCAASTTSFICLLSRKLSLVFCKPLLQVCRRLESGLLRLTSRSGTTRSSASRGFFALCFGLMVLYQDPLIVLLYDVLWDTFHPKDLDVKACTIW